jgi:hypothetical protein
LEDFVLVIGSLYATDVFDYVFCEFAPL